MLSRIHVYAASLGLLLAGPAVALCQSSTAVMLNRASAASQRRFFGMSNSHESFNVLGSNQPFRWGSRERCADR
jgi:hypothetical protein